MGVLGTTITPWGQFFISSFAFDKKIDEGHAQVLPARNLLGSLPDRLLLLLHDCCHCSSTLFARGIVLTSGEQAAEAIRPFAGDLAGTLFAVGILAAAFMGLVIVPLSTAYAFSEFFGLSGSLDSDYQESKTFYILFMIQLVVAALITAIPGISLFHFAIATQTLNAMILPLVFYYLIKLTSDRSLMGEHVNSGFERTFTSWASVLIVIASVVTIGGLVFRTSEPRVPGCAPWCLACAGLRQRVACQSPRFRPILVVIPAPKEPRA